MSEVFLINSIRAESGEPVEMLEARLYAQAQIRRGWLEQADIIGATAAARQVGGPFVRSWPAESGLQHFLLQQAARTLLAGDAHLAAVVEAGAGAALLASPEAVGVYNLSPRAALLARLGLPNGADLAALLKRRKLELEEGLVCAAAELSAEQAQRLAAALPGGAALPQAQEGFWQALDTLLEKMSAQHPPAKGVLASAWQAGALLTLLEPL
ncbi:hypothetical protein ADN00_14555 [Ornatilinea apprima]|uniref:Uncharacterized protein n=1 Tax=Ornatilinea apprima TaxID=1134406 RepID=A0A0P6X2F2_9CHLR|nr:hypothetical protein [Ornatilinea apprima]KPL73561.1 hypothetical protein ADN00_14555 [Ornatilinea apprima]